MTAEVKVRLSIDGAKAAVSQADSVAESIDGIGAASVRAGQDASTGSQRAADAIKRLGGQAQVSAAQTAAAMRMLPAQMTDIGVGLASGQSPFMVLMQQGGQLKDMFGGVRPALAAVASQVVGLVNPLTLLAAAATAVFVAYQQGRGETEAFNRALIMSGNAAGTNAGAMSDMAQQVSAVVGTHGKAADVIAQLAGTGKVAAADLQQYATVAIQVERSIGQSVDDTVKAFASLAKDPVSASKSLNDSLNYLSASTYRQIKAMQEQGDVASAANIAQEAYAAAMKTRAAQVEQQLGALEKGWRAVKDGAKAAWDAMLGIGREKSLQQQLAEAQRQLEQSPTKRRGTAGPDPREAIREHIAMLQEQIRMQAMADGKAADDAAANAKGIQDADRARQVADANAALSLAQSKATSQAKLAQIETEQSQLQVLNAQGLISADEYDRRRFALQQRALEERARQVAEEIKIEASRPINDPAARIQQRAKLVELRAQMASTQSEISRLPLAQAAASEARALEDARQLAQQYAALWQQAQQQAQTYADQNARAMASLITDPLARARAEAEISAKAIERQAAALAVQLKSNIDLMRAAGMNTQADAQQGQLDALNKSSGEAASNARLQADRDYANQLVNQNPGAQLADGFDKASQSLSSFTRSFSSLVQMQQDFARAKAAEGLSDEQRAKLAAAETMRSINAYGTLAGASKGFFKQNTAGYKVLSTAEKAFRAYELGLAIKTAAEKMGLITAGTTAKVAATAAEASAVVAGQGVETGAVTAGEAARNTAKVPGVFLSFMSSLGPWGMAAAAAAVALVLGNSHKGGGVGFAPSNTGAGTVLGDGGTQSKSLANSIEKLKDVDTMTMRYSAQMLAALQSIESNIGALATLIAQAGGVDLSSSAGKLGSSVTVDERTASIIARTWEKNFTITPYLRGLMGNLNNSLGRGISNGFGSSSAIVGQGITGGPQTLGSIAQNGFAAQYFANIEEKHKLFWGTISTTTSTQLAAADADVQRNLTLILNGFAGAVTAAAGPLGASLDKVKADLSGFVVDIGKISDLTPDNLQAVFSAIGDNIAKAALGGFEAFQQVGEGYLETITRVASGAELASVALDRLGIHMVGLQDLANKQGDLATELVRASLLAAEGVNGIADIISTLSGSASEIADTYKALTDVRTSLDLLGLSGSAVTRSLITGAGSLSALTDGISAYEENFFSEAEQQAIKTGRLRTEFQRLGLAVPSTRDGFRQLVDSIDTSTDAGQRLLGSLLPLAGAFADITDAAATAGQGIADEIARLRGLSASTSASATYAQLQASFSTLTAQARAGDSTAIDKLPEASKALSDALSSVATDRVDLARMQAGLANSLQATLDIVRGDAAAPGSSVPSAIDAATSAATSAASTAQTQADMLSELKALRQEVRALRDERQLSSSEVVRNTGRTATILANVTQGGDAASVRLVP